MNYIPPSSRITFLSGVVVVLALVLVGQLYFVQIVQGEEFRSRAGDQYISSAEVFKRGAIYFTEKNSDRRGAAIMKHGYILAIAPGRMTNAEEAYEKLSEVVEIDRVEFLDSAKKKKDPYEKIIEHLSEEVAKKVRELDLDGVGLYRQTWRYYPSEALASQVLGYYGYGKGGKSGRYGLEQYYNDVLSRDETDLSVNFFAEVFAGITPKAEGSKKNEDEKKNGVIYTTIEPTVQTILEKNLAQAKKRWNAAGVGGIVMDPQTGAVYAMASLPEFDPNKYSESHISSYNNPLVESVFEMGSIIKALTMASGLDSGAVNLGTTYYDTGTRTINGRTIANYDFVARGRTNMQNILNHSLNLGAVFVMEQMGQEQFADYFRKFGLDEKTGIDLPNEEKSLLHLKDRRNIGYATASYGQGIALTPIATIRALSALGNGGTLPYPHVVERIDYLHGPDWVWKEGSEERVISSETSETISRMLVTVMDDYMLGGTVDLEHHSIAAKTGTAQVVKPGGGYYENRFFHSYFGYYPAYDPKFIVFLYMEHPKGVLYASHTLTKPFMDTAKFILNYYEVPPDR